MCVCVCVWVCVVSVTASDSKGIPEILTQFLRHHWNSKDSDRISKIPKVLKNISETPKKFLWPLSDSVWRVFGWLETLFGSAEISI